MSQSSRCELYPSNLSNTLFENVLTSGSLEAALAIIAATVPTLRPMFNNDQTLRSGNSSGGQHFPVTSTLGRSKSPHRGSADMRSSLPTSTDQRSNTSWTEESVPLGRLVSSDV